MTVTMAHKRPEFTWENIRVNDDLGVVSGAITEDAVRAHAFSIGDDPARYLSSTSGSVAPPTLVSNELLKLFFLGYEFPPPFKAGLHTRAQISYHSPILVGEPIELRGTHIARYVRRGRRYRVQHSQATKADGSVAVEMIATETVGYDVRDEPDTGEVPQDWASSAAPVNPADHPREVAASPLRRISYEQSVLFSGLPFSWAHEAPRPVHSGTHTNADNAEAAGYDKPIVQGLLPAAHLTVELMDHYGERIYRGTRISFAFLSPVFVRSSIRTTCVAMPEHAAQAEEPALLFATDEAGRLTTIGHVRVPR